MSVWFITGAGRGLGLDIAKAALAAGHKVVATGRNTEKVARAVGGSENLLVVKLDVTSAADAEAAAQATLERFGRSMCCPFGECSRQGLARPGGSG